MTVSILHRITGTALALGGGVMLIWWLTALASGPESYTNFLYYAVSADAADAWGRTVNVLIRIAAIGISWSFFQHMLSGLRHFVLDLGAGYELKTNKSFSIFILFASVMLTAAMWMFIFMRHI